MNKVYIITAGSYSAYHIVAAFTEQAESEKFRDTYNSRLGRFSEECHVEEFPIGADMSLAGKDLYNAVRNSKGEVYAYQCCESVFDFSNKIGIVERYGIGINCYIAVPMNQDDPEEYARKVAADLFAEYDARNEGIT